MSWASLAYACGVDTVVAAVTAMLNSTGSRVRPVGQSHGLHVYSRSHA